MLARHSVPQTLGLLVVLAALAGCGPTRATALQAEAEAALAAARDAGAVERAPYEWTAAETYFNAAKAEASRADFEDAAALSEKVLEFAEKARAKALTDPAPVPAPDPLAEGGQP